ncbi:copper homeostasis protein CutC [Roseibium sediminis]|uniref:copper homeostasis protein CutC n=1 Tax=Roseibium sediminis TaxID=1775174 RepID=UPI00123E3A21|nr:copper homeostasis protein CutC [Roseibium sediminis]
MGDVLLEVCVDTPAGARIAAESGADRLELCASLNDGGLTPTGGLQRFAQDLGIPVYVMLRPRQGDFAYTEDEKTVILRDAREAGQNGAQGIVVGAITADLSLDTDFLARVLDEAGLPATLHRAFDTVQEPEAALEDAVKLGFERILTSGHAPRAEDGTDLIARLVELASGRISIMPGSGVTSENVQSILQKTGAREVHSSCSSILDCTSQSPLAHTLGFVPTSGIKETSADAVAAMKAVLRSEHRVVA